MVKHPAVPRIKPASTIIALTVCLAVILCASLTLAASNRNTDDANVPSMDGLAARFSGSNLFMAGKNNQSTRRIYAASSDGVSHMQIIGESPFTLDVKYTLNGPNVPARKLDGAHGLVGMHITARVNTLAHNNIQQLGQQMRPFVFLSIPSAAVDDVSASEGVDVRHNGSTITIGATSEPGATLDFHVYVDAKHFSMSPILLAVLPQSAPTSYAAQLQSLARESSTLVNSITGENNDDANAKLIDELERLREQERVLAQQQIAQADAAHKRAFHEYMTAYVGSYTAHLSGSVGNSTQLTALMGTAGELNGDTPLARAVTNLASAVNARSDAYQHIGAADEVDWIIRRIRQRGTQGLMAELSQRAGMNSRDGAQDYAAGQKQLSNAMVPYSMAYTDAYTENLNTLTGGDVSRAQVMGAQAIARTDAQFANSTLTSDQAKVDAAMNELAQAREHTGASSADRQIALRYADRFSNAAADASGAAQHAGLVTPIAAIASQVHGDWLAHSIGGKIVGARTKAIADAREKERRQQSDDAQASSSLVVASDDDAAADVSKFAGSAAAGFGVKGGEVNGNTTTHCDSDAGGTSAPHRERVLESERLATQFGISDLASGLVLHADLSQVIDETVLIGGARPSLEAGAAMCAPTGGLANRLAQDTADHWPNLHLLFVYAW